MTAASCEFGYYPRRLNVIAGPVTVQTLADLADSIAKVEASPCVEGDWIYSPFRMASGPSDRPHHPYPARVFSLPKTHAISHVSPDAAEHVQFHVCSLSFFLGMRLDTTEAGFLDATPIRPGKLIDFVQLGERQLVSAVELAEAFWIAHREDTRRAMLIVAAIHALFLAQRPQLLQFERFSLLCTAVDACYRLAATIHTSPGRLPHAKRVPWMCQLFSIPVPSWAEAVGSSRSEISFIRNEAAHEGLYIGQPLGFALHGVGKAQNLPLEIEHLISRLLVALLGADGRDYVKTGVDSYQMHGLDL